LSEINKNYIEIYNAILTNEHKDEEINEEKDEIIFVDRLKKIKLMDSYFWLY
jgi:hypothetical protein